MRLYISYLFIGLTIALFNISNAKDYSENNILDYYKEYSAGPDLNIDAQDVELVSLLATATKDNNGLNELYKLKLSTDLLKNSDTFLIIKTPTYLIAEHAREQSREYREIDHEYIEYLKKLGAVKLDLIQGYYRGVTLAGVRMSAILLRDGKRVEALKSVALHRGKFPFATEIEKQTSQILSQSQINTQNIPKVEISTEDMEAALRGQGYSEEEVRLYTDLSKSYLSNSQNINSDERALNESDNIFSLSELSKPGKYEIVYRTDPSSIRGAGDKEVRKTLSFNKFK